MLRRGISGRNLKDISTFRKIAAVMWEHPKDPKIYGELEVRAEKLLDFIEDYRKKKKEKVTVTCAVVQSLALALRKHPELNAFVRNGRIFQRENVDIFVQVAIPSEEGRKADLSGVKIENSDKKSLAQISEEIRRSAERIREGRDPSLKSAKTFLGKLPPLILRRILGFLEFIQYSLNIDTGILGIPSDPFGSAMVTNVGVFKLVGGYAPFTPIARTPIIALVGQVCARPVVEDEQIKVGKVLPIFATLDHRIIDGFHASVIAGEVKQMLEYPHESLF